MLRLERLTKRFGGDVLAVDDVSLEVDEGEFVTLLGPSGCGKTTTLRMIAGFETPSSGRILLQDEDVTGTSPQRRGIGMVFQNYALFPHLDVFENVAFGLKARGESKDGIGDRVARALELVDLAGYQDRKVQQLSGGQQQRIALARALAPEPPVLLLDEPLSNLDAALRERTRSELRALLKRLGVTVIFVTHDQEEAFALSDRIALLEGGRLQQLGAPETLYDRPANPFVASFLGHANFLDARVVDVQGDALVCELGGGGGNGGGDDRRANGGVRWRAAASVEPVAGEPFVGRAVRVLVRPEALRLESGAAPGARRGGDDVEGGGEVDGSGDREAGAEVEGGGNLASGDGDRGAGGGAARDDRRPGLSGTVVERRFLGAVTYYRVRTDAGVLTVRGTAASADEGDDVRVTLAEDAVVRAYPSSSAPDMAGSAAAGRDRAPASSSGAGAVAGGSTGPGGAAG